MGRARLGAGHGPVGAGISTNATTSLSDRQRRTLDRIQQRARVQVRSIRMDDFDAEVGRFFEVYNAAWSDNWGFAPMPEAEIRHLAGQLKQIINPNWAFGLETPDGAGGRPSAWLSPTSTCSCDGSAPAGCCPSGGTRC